MAPLQLYNPKKNLIVIHLNCTDRNQDLQLEQCENFILIRNFNVEMMISLWKNSVRSTVAKVLSKIIRIP